MSKTCSRRQDGFTLVEAVMVIAVTGIVAAATSSFIAGPVRAYVDTARRANLADTADTALRRLARDVEASVPNSLRLTISGGVTYLEMIPALQAGHYRSLADPSGTGGPVLDFTLTGSTFEILGPFDPLPAGASIVVFNLGNGISNADAYAGANRKAVSSVAGTTMNYTLGASQFPLPSPSDRFYAVSTALTYVCDPVAGTLTRYSGYAIQAAQPVSTAAAPLSGATRGVVARNISATGCGFTYSTTWQNRSLLAVNLGLSAQTDSINYFQEMSIPNVP